SLSARGLPTSASAATATPKSTSTPPMKIDTASVPLTLAPRVSRLTSKVPAVNDSVYRTKASEAHEAASHTRWRRDDARMVLAASSAQLALSSATLGGQRSRRRVS